MFALRLMDSDGGYFIEREPFVQRRRCVAIFQQNKNSSIPERHVVKNPLFFLKIVATATNGGGGIFATAKIEGGFYAQSLRGEKIGTASRAKQPAPLL